MSRTAGPRARVHAFGECRIDGPGQRSQAWRVGVDEIDELWTHQWRSGGEVQMVADEHRLPDSMVGSKAAARVGEDDGFGAGGARGPDGVDHGGYLVPS